MILVSFLLFILTITIYECVYLYIYLLYLMNHILYSAT